MFGLLNGPAVVSGIMLLPQGNFNIAVFQDIAPSGYFGEALGATMGAGNGYLRLGWWVILLDAIIKIIDKNVYKITCFEI